MPDGRKRASAIAATLVSLIALVGVVLSVATPAANAKPDLETAKKQYEKYEHLAEQASERYNDAKVKLEATQTKLSALNADLARQQQVVDTMRQQVATMVVEQYQGDALSTTSQVVLSSNPDAFLDNLNAVSAYNNQRGLVMKQFGNELDRLQLRKAAVQDEAAQLKKLQDSLAAEKAQTDEKSAQAKKVLDDLEAKARQQILSGGWTGNIPNVAASGRAAAAVHFAMAQVGKAYVYGAAGPNAYDCSGLTMRAWGAAGVGLPHSAAAQQGSG